MQPDHDVGHDLGSLDGVPQTGDLLVGRIETILGGQRLVELLPGQRHVLGGAGLEDDVGQLLPPVLG